MNITLTEIKAQQDRVRREIIERECVLAALDVVQKSVASGRAPASIDLASFVSALIPTAHTHEWKELAASSPATESQASPPVEQYVHPELKALAGDHGSHTKFVRWAIGQMTRDYSLHHIAALLKREGMNLSTAKISVVISRLKKWGEIEEIRPGQGPIPALFRRPDITRPEDFKPLDLDLPLPKPPFQHMRNPIYSAYLPEEFRMEDDPAPAGDRSLR